MNLRRTLTGRFVAGCAVLALICAGGFTVMLNAVLDQRAATREARASDDQITAAAVEEKLLVDLETGLRGYQLTRDTKLLAPYYAAVDGLPAATSHLNDLVESEPAEARAVLAIHANINAYIDDYGRPLVSQIEAGRIGEAGNRAKVSEGKVRVDRVRAQFDSFTTRERRSAETLRADAEDSASRAILFGSLGIAGTLLMVALFGLYTLSSVLRPIRRASAAAHRLATGDLSARVPQAGGGEIAELAGAFNTMADSLEHSRDELESQNSELEAQQAELERAVDELAFEKERFERLHLFGRSVSAEIELEPIATTVLDELAALSAIEVGALYAKIEGRPGATCVGTLALGPADSIDPVISNTGLAGRALAEGKTLSSGHGDSSLTVAALGGRATVRHELHVPLIHGRRVVGLISLARVTDHPFHPAEIDQIDHFANRAAASVANALTLREARDQAALNEAVLDSASDAFMTISNSGTIVAWNPAAERLYGWSADDIMGRSMIETIVPPRLRDPWNPAAERLYGWSAEEVIGRSLVDTVVPTRLRQAWIDGIDRSVSTGEMVVSASGVEMIAQHRAGHEFPVEAIIAPLERDGELSFNAFVRDISARKRAERYKGTQLAVTRALSEAGSLQAARDGINAALGATLGFEVAISWVVDSNVDAVRPTGFWSAEGVEADEFREMTEGSLFAIGEGLPGRVWATGEALWVEDLTQERAFGRAAAAFKNGLRSALVIPISSGERMIGMAELFSREMRSPDPEMLALLSAVGVQVGQFSERKYAEMEADRLKDEFFALVSHELRTPLTSIIGYLELILEDNEDFDETTTRFLTVIERNSRRLHRLVGDLLFVAQVEAGKLQLESVGVSLPSVIDACVVAAMPRAESGGVTLKARTEDVGTALGDPDRLGQVLDNLVSNAIKFTPEGGTVDVYLARRGDSAVIDVRDSGIGIPAGEQDSLFQRFFRSSSATEKAIQGVGLGLVITRAIVEAHGGSIEFESEEGRGTTFRVVLPLISLDTPQFKAAPQEVSL